MKFSELASYFEKIEQVSSRLTITEVLSDLFKKLHKNEIKHTVYLLQGRLCPLYEKLDFGMAEKMVIKSALIALNIEAEHFKTEFQKQGDVGKTIEHFKKLHPSLDEQKLTIPEVYEQLHTMATASGPGSQEVKVGIMANLIRHLDSLSSRYAVRIPIGAIRLGFSDMTVLDAYSWMLTGGKTLKAEIEKSYHVRPDLGYIGYTLKTEGIEGLKHVKPELFTPILMMRAERLSSGAEIIEKMGKCAVEPKYDGFRLQVHYKKSTGEVRLYTRGLEDATYMYPDIVEGIKKEIKADSIILEGEAIGYDNEKHAFLPFQETTQRKRKYDIEEMAKKIPLKLFSFELLYKNGKSYIHEPYEERRKELSNALKTTGEIEKDTIIIAPSTLMDDPVKLEVLFDEEIEKGLEGIIAKKLDGTYQAGARGWNWIKFKRSYSSKIQDTIDCLVMGYDYGKGKRASFGIGAFLVGIYDHKKDQFVTVAKIGTGLTDDEWRALKAQSSKFKVQNKPALYDVDKVMECDVWVKPYIVVEIKADEITRSTVHTAGRVLKPSKSGSAFDVEKAGYALRFPRLVRFRDDKRPEEATTLKEVDTLQK